MGSGKILILGGYGTTGRLLARLLLQETDIELVLAGRNIQRAEKTADELNASFPGKRVTAACADASDAESLQQAMAGVIMVAVASSTSQYAGSVAQAAILAGVDYFDVQYSSAKLGTLRMLRPEIEAAGRCYITDGGFHPGLPAAMIRWAAPHFDRLQSANVGSVIKVDWRSLEFSPETIEELVSEFMDFKNLIFKNGQWQPGGILSWLLPKWMDFGSRFGRQYTIPMFLEEMRPIPDLYLHLEETGFYVGGFNWFVDWIISPLVMILPKIFPRKGIQLSSNMMAWGLRKFSKPPYGTMLRLDARGIKDGQPADLDITLYHEDGYMLTAIPAAACLRQYLDGSIRKPGLWLQALAVEPDRLMKDMQRMGVEMLVNDL